jgi:dolichyl-phosphate-mannose-protein mannosyltransferase
VRSRAERLVAWVAVALVIVVVAWARSRYLEVPLERDEGEFAYGGQLLLQGIPPFRLAYNMKLPGIYAAYAAIMTVFGQTIVGVRLGLICVNAVSTVLVFLVARRIISPIGGIAAAAVFAILSIGTSVLGGFAHATHFIVLPALGGFLLLESALDNSRSWQFLVSGCLFAFAVLMKQPAVVFPIAAVVWWAYHRAVRSRATAARMLTELAPLIAGVVLPIVLTMLALWWAGVFERFWFWNFEYLREYAAQRSLADGFTNLRYRMAEQFTEAPIAWSLALFGLLGLLLEWRAWARIGPIVGLGILSFAAVCPGFYFRRHYFIVMLPVIGLLAGAGIDLVVRRMSGTPGLAIGVVCATLSLAVVQPIFTQRDLLLGKTPAAMSRAISGSAVFPESIEIARYIREHSTPDDRIAVLGSEPQIYFYANRKSATGYIYMYGLMEIHPFARLMQRELVQEIETARPKFITVVSERSSWLANPRSDVWIFDRIRSLVDANYRPVGVADIVPDEATEYRWGEAAAERPPRSEANIVLLQRQ